MRRTGGNPVLILRGRSPITVKIASAGRKGVLRFMRAVPRSNCVLTRGGGAVGLAFLTANCGCSQVSGAAV